MKNIVVGGGCFWCLEAIFSRIRGVSGVTSGYCGGDVIDPSYESVCTGQTGHAEVVRVVYDPDKISLDDLLDIFFNVHDPTTLNKQGNDVGTQYRSEVFYTTPEEKLAAQAAIDRFAENLNNSNTVVTKISPLETFYPAEQYHHNYYSLHPTVPYCQAVVSPKVRKFMDSYKHFLDQPE